MRVLNMGAGAGLLAMETLRLGAYHVTCSERWLYLAMVCKEILLSNGFSDDQVKVVYKRPCDLALLRDVPVYCNLCVADLLDDGLLASGLIPGLKHALNNLLLPDAIIMPASADVYIQVPASPSSRWSSLSCLFTVHVNTMQSKPQLGSCRVSRVKLPALVLAYVLITGGGWLAGGGDAH